MGTLAFAIEMKFSLLLRFSPLLGFTPPATLLSKSRKKNSAPFSELSAVEMCSSVVLALALEGLAVYAAKDIVGSSTAGVVPTPALQSPTLANQQQQPQRQLPPQQLTRLLVVQQPQAVPPPLEVTQLLVATPQPLVVIPQPLVVTPQQPLVVTPQQPLNQSDGATGAFSVMVMCVMLVLHLEMLPQPAVKQQLALLQPLLLLLLNNVLAKLC